MGLKECNITLDDAGGVYYPGQEIKGRVDYTFDSPKKLKGISIKFKGESEVRWTTRKSRTRNGKTTHYTEHHYADEGYFNSLFWLIGGQDNEIELKEGKYSYPFAFSLPITLPSSFEGEFGYVRYTIKVTLDRPWKFDQDTKLAFTVISHMDLNMIEEARAPINMHLNKFFCCCWCKSGPLLVDVNLPMYGYCCGQTIPFDINVENGSNVKINGISLILRKVVTYHSHMPRYDSKRIGLQIAKLVTEPILAHSTVVLNKNMEIPPLPPSNLRNCRIIDIDYEIEVSANSSGCHMNSTVISPIIIGTIPLAGYQTPMPECNTGNTSFQPAIYPPNSTGVTDPPPPYPYPTAPYALNPAPSAPPAMDGIDSKGVNPNFAQQPVFRESKFGTSNIHDSGDNQYTMISGNAYFAPRYPTYGFRIPE